MFTKVWQEVKFPFFTFLVWRIFLILVAFISPAFFQLQDNFLGGGKETYQQNPLFWGHLNFDGEHYLAIAQRGYRDLEYFYFPPYPLLIGYIAKLLNGQIVMYAAVGLIISHIAFFLALTGLYKLIKLDFKENVAMWSLTGLLIFPTSFYFASFYTESLFLMVVIWSFYFARKGKWFLTGMLGALLSATRLVGIVLLPSLIIEYIKQKRGLKIASRKSLFLFLIPLGIVTYMIYLNKVTNDPLEFLHTVEIFGFQRSSALVLLPQVFYRYLLKILPNLDYSYLSVVFTTLLEFSVALIFLALSVLTFFRLRLSYAVYTSLAFIIPTLSGSFSSMPRYVLVLFPAYIMIGIWLLKKGRLVKVIYFLLNLTLLIISESLFFRGFWVS
ncbi:hypothetical protein A2961_01150 [Candidatus Woesebacteria bacterium RIFCSPLOWO2_01_FULL_39_21]|uniref:Glycosyltransferase RgtA/B/C/D-like domain-containing protein n=1 Tax=Candidatus Woesebacteria bacterium RIFCSPLOWO2_01_FULL_39_21 TaxID=1802519 RepID=A0A1F8BHL9_9BACT|nr:MAG: hypothetical protein A2691_00220 [Candidatus Woesebacteria bacterium RIFCSPHIGHO2_01_FULL_39_23]OGM63556.1 MAG: hypothetical protein A2961_01150 [Candidatus Woesebacteria bacterium RIFCSPLOWO2_01_FULL_39_21]